MLTYWIPDEPCMLPGSPSHQIGVGGFVMNDKREVQLTSCFPFSLCCTLQPIFSYWKILQHLIRSLWWKKNALVVALECGRFLLVTSIRWWCLSLYSVNSFVLFPEMIDSQKSYTTKCACFDSSQSEDLFSGAVREVKEETGVSTVQLSISWNC